MAKPSVVTEYEIAESLVHDKELAEAIGHMMIAWSRTEVCLQHLLMKILNVPEYQSMAIFYRLPTFESKVKVIQSLIESWLPKDCDKDAIAKIVETISSLSLTRNSWVHGTWLVDAKTSKTLVASIRKKIERKPVKAHDIINHRNTITGVTDSLFEALYANTPPKSLEPPSLQSDDLPRPRAETYPLRKPPTQS